MRILFVVQRYGHEVAGGAERHCREFATHLAARGHDVEALTSRAVSYVDWADEYPAGDTLLDGVTVHRLGVVRPRDEARFGPLNSRVAWGRKPVPFHLQREWMRQQGPLLDGLPGWLADHAPSFDVVVFFGYLYAPTWEGLPLAAGLVPTVFHPLAHEEPQLRLPLFERCFRSATTLAFSVPEEQAMVQELYPADRLTSVIGIGFDLDAVGDGARFRDAFGIGDDPYLLFVGRIDPGKGAYELLDHFRAYKRRNGGRLRLVFLGEPVYPIKPADDLVVTGFAGEQTKRDAIDGALALAVPSFFESFSMVLAEGWVQSKPALVQGRCAVLDGQARRSGAALPYRGFAELEASVQLLVDQPGLAAQLGANGRGHVETHYSWDAVMTRYERLLELAVATGTRAGGRRDVGAPTR